MSQQLTCRCAVALQRFSHVFVTRLQSNPLGDAGCRRILAVMPAVFPMLQAGLLSFLFFLHVNRTRVLAFDMDCVCRFST
jgi:hypothetical protein